MAENTYDIDDNQILDSLIIGSGAAGYTAGLYLSRASHAPVLLAGTEEPGGALTTTTLVENYPGFPDGVQGLDLMDNMRIQAEKFGTRVEYESATKVELNGDIKTIYTEEGSTYKAKTVIIATGSEYRTLNAPGELEYRGRGVSYCATCDGFFFRGKKVLVVGGGDSAMTSVDFMTTFTDSLTLIHRRDTFRASPIMVERVKKNPHVTIETNTVVDEIIGDGEKVTGVKLKNTLTGEVKEVPMDGIFVTVGSIPKTSFLEGQVELDEKGYIKTEGASTRTNIPGVYAAGDVADPVYRQAISAAGTGCRAALDAQDYLLKKSM